MVGGGAGPGDAAGLLQAFVGDAVVVVDGAGGGDAQLVEDRPGVGEVEFVSRRRAVGRVRTSPRCRCGLRGRVLGLVVLDHAGFRVGHHAFVLGPGGDGEDDMGVGGGLGEEEVELRVELGGVVPLLDHPVVGQGDEGVVADADEAADLAALHLPDHFHHGGPGCREFGLLDAPDLADLAAVLLVHDGTSAGEEVGLLAVLASALPVALAGDRAVGRRRVCRCGRWRCRG